MVSTVLLTNQASRALQVEEGDDAPLISKIRIINTQVARCFEPMTDVNLTSRRDGWDGIIIA
jgi:hypothetical protein